MTSLQLILFKEKELTPLSNYSTSLQDAYTNEIQKALIHSTENINIHHISVLETTFVHQSELKASLDRLSDGFWGIVFTSKRAVNAIKQVWNHIDLNARDNFKRIPLFAVGKATAKAIYELLQITDVSVFYAGSMLSEDADGLSKVIVEYYNSNPNVRNSAKTLFFPAGDKRRDTLPNILHAQEIAVSELTVYTTHTRSSKQIWKEMEPLVLDSFEQNNGLERNVGAALFSPSGVKAIVDAFKEGDAKVNWRFLAAIGKTTALAIRKAQQLEQFPTCPIIISQRPSAASLAECIKHFVMEK